MRANFPLIAVSGLLLCVTACSGGSGSPEPDNRNTQVGYLIDGPVSGVSFVTPTHRGETAKDGSFSYEPGEVVRFAVGDTLLGEVPGQVRVTPFDLAGTVPLTGTARLDDAIHRDNDPFHTVINLAVFLQSMDWDGDPENGIEITPDARALLSGVRLDLYQPWPAFQRDFALRQIMGRANSEAVFANAHGTIHPAIALKHLYRAVDIDPKIFGLSRYEVREATGSLTAAFTYQYDENGFVTEHAVSLNSENPETLIVTSRWRYDANGNMTGLSTGSPWFWWQWRYDELGNLIREEDHYDADEVPDRITSYLYDSSGNVLRSALDGHNLGNEESYTVAEYGDAGQTLHVSSYNAEGALTFQVDYGYDERNNLVQAREQTSPGAPYPTTTIIKGWQYNARNQLTRFEYDGDADGAADVIDVWEYDAEGRLVLRQQGRPSQGEPITPVSSFDYDSQGRLVKQQNFLFHPFITPLQEWEFHDTYTQYTAVYDADGNVSAETTYIRREHFDSNGTITKAGNDEGGDGHWDVTYNFDANGNLAAPGREYQPTAWGHLFSGPFPANPVVTLYPEVKEPKVQARCCRNPL